MMFRCLSSRASFVLTTRRTLVVRSQSGSTRALYSSSLLSRSQLSIMCRAGIQQQQQQQRKLHLSPREVEHLQLHQAGRLAQYRLARGWRLNHPEAVALISLQLMEAIRSGQTSVAALMSVGQRYLGRNQVMEGVAEMIASVQIEATFPDGTKLLTVHSPISTADGDLIAALEGSFLPIPSYHLFHVKNDNENQTTVASSSSHDDATRSSHPLLIPGEVMPNVAAGDIILNVDNGSFIELPVTNTGDRPIQVGSHYAFVETNKALKFDRQAAIGKRLNIPSGTAVRFEPGESKQVTLVSFGGTQTVVTGNRLTGGSAAPEHHDFIMERVVSQGFQHESTAIMTPGRAYSMDRASYADMYGPTVGDKIRLADTNLEIRVEQDYTVYGDECKFGGGKTIREGMGQSTSTRAAEALDTVITNALIVDAILGVVKADIGIKGSTVVGIGKAGNPDVMNGVSPDMIIGNGTLDSWIKMPMCVQRAC